MTEEILRSLMAEPALTAYTFPRDEHWLVTEGWTWSRSADDADLYTPPPGVILHHLAREYHGQGWAETREDVYCVLPEEDGTPYLLVVHGQRVSADRDDRIERVELRSTGEYAWATRLLAERAGLRVPQSVSAVAESLRDVLAERNGWGALPPPNDYGRGYRAGVERSLAICEGRMG